MSAPQTNKLQTPWKSRVAYVHYVGDDAIYLLVHPSGELLIISNRNRGAARWDRACILWIDERNEYWMCKYGEHDKKFSLNGLTEEQLTSLAINFGIEFRPKGGRRMAPAILDSLAARSLLNWTNKHPRMTKENSTILSYLDVLEDIDALPLPDADYTGY